MSVLKPALVLGSGFHRHVFGDVDVELVRPLYDWHALVDRVAMRMQVAAPSRTMPPVQRWETLILRAGKEGFRDHKFHWVTVSQSPQTHVIEKEARRAVAEVLNEATRNYPQSVRASIPQSDCWGAVISLNFDEGWMSSNGTKPSFNSAVFGEQAFGGRQISHREHRRLTSCSVLPGINDGAFRRVWFPNGACTTPETIRMGLHDYGAAAHSIQVAFARLKQWERDSGLAGKSPEVQFASVTAALRTASEGVNTLSACMGEPALPLTWVADFLYRPLVFAGVGMSEQETGLWWLLAQRARNTARIGMPANTFILVSADERSAFWRTKPFGLVPLFCSNWDEGWEMVLEKASTLNEK